MDRTFSARRSERASLHLPARFVTGGGVRDAGIIVDISSEGCRVQFSHLFSRIGTRVVIRPEGFDGLNGVVRWIHGDCAGIEFASKLYGPVLDHLIAKYRDGTPVSVEVGRPSAQGVESHTFRSC